MKKIREFKADKTFRLRLAPEVMKWIIKDMEKVKKCNSYGLGNIPSRATEFYHWYKTMRKGFLINLIENHYEEIKHLVRKIGRARKNGS